MCLSVAAVGAGMLHTHRLGEVNSCAIYVWPLFLPSKTPFEENQNHGSLTLKWIVSYWVGPGHDRLLVP